MGSKHLALKQLFCLDVFGVYQGAKAENSYLFHYSVSLRILYISLLGFQARPLLTMKARASTGKSSYDEIIILDYKVKEILSLYIYLKSAR